jgi:hypothetical protein
MESVKKFSLAEVRAVLSHTPATLNALLRGLPDTWVMSNEGRRKTEKIPGARSTSWAT